MSDADRKARAEYLSWRRQEMDRIAGDLLSHLKAMDKFITSLGGKQSKEMSSLQLRCRLAIDQAEADGIKATEP